MTMIEIQRLETLLQPSPLSSLPLAVHPPSQKNGYLE